MKIYCLKHVPFEGPGLITKWAKLHGHRIVEVDLFTEDPLPPVKEGDGLLVMGGPMNIYQYRDYPFLKKEVEFLRRALNKQIKTVGICLGAQLLADVLGGKVYQGPVKEIGWMPVDFTPEARQWCAGLPKTLSVLHWHGDTYDLPEGAVRLAKSKHCKEQGFLYKDIALGLQFHMEMTNKGLEGISHVCADELITGVETIHSAERMKKETEFFAMATETALFKILDRFYGN